MYLHSFSRTYLDTVNPQPATMFRSLSVCCKIPRLFILESQGNNKLTITECITRHLTLRNSSWYALIRSAEANRQNNLWGGEGISNGSWHYWPCHQPIKSIYGHNKMGLKCRNRIEFIEFISSFGICVFTDVYVGYLINIEYVKV
jgi:hypothetical protein